MRRDRRTGVIINDLPSGRANRFGRGESSVAHSYSGRGEQFQDAAWFFGLTVKPVQPIGRGGFAAQRLMDGSGARFACEPAPRDFVDAYSRPSEHVCNVICVGRCAGQIGPVPQISGDGHVEHYFVVIASVQPGRGCASIAEDYFGGGG